MTAAVVIDMGGTSIRLGHVARGDISGIRTTLATESLREAADPTAWLAQAVEAYTREHDLRLGRLVIGVPFTPDRHRTTALSSPNIRNLEGAPIKRSLEARLGVEVTLERDINLLLLGEWFAGAAQGVDVVFGMFIGTGVGGSLLGRGVPYRGATGAAIELGHIPIRAEGKRCVCGNTDCLEAYACGHTLIALAAEARVEVVDIFIPTSDGVLRERLQAFVRDLAYALATAVNLFQPDVAVVGGGIPAMRGFPRQGFESLFFAHLRNPIPKDTVRLVWAELGSNAALWGALALEALEKGPP